MSDKHTYTCELIERVHNEDGSIDYYERIKKVIVFAWSFDDAYKIATSLSKEITDERVEIAKQRTKFNTIMTMKVARAMPPIGMPQDETIMFVNMFIVKNLDYISIF